MEKGLLVCSHESARRLKTGVKLHLPTGQLLNLHKSKVKTKIANLLGWLSQPKSIQTDLWQEKCTKLSGRAHAKQID